MSQLSHRALTFALAVIGSGLVLVGGQQVAHATTLTVNTAEDIGPDPLTGRFPTDGKCSLRAAIRAAESNSNAHDVDCATGVPDAEDVIVLDAGLAGQTFRMTYAIDGNVQPFDTIISGGPLSIVGETENAADFVISGEGVVRPFTLGWFNIAAASLTLANLTVANGDGTANGASVGGLDGFGGAFYLGDNGTTGSTLTLDNVVLKNNSAAFNGGAIYGTMLNITNNGGAYVGNSSTRGGAISVSSGPFTLNGYAVAFDGNRASDKGGAIYSNPGNEPMLVHLERSLLRDNAAVSAGGVVYVDSSRREKVFELHDSTATGNSSVFFAQANFQSFEILRSTFVDSGEIWRAGAGFMANSIVTGRSSCSYPGGPGIGGSRNLVDSPGCGIGSIGAVTGLGSLAQNGGPKVQQTFGLNPGSNAIDNGDPAHCGTVDARSIGRGVDGDGTPNSPQTGDCDIGSYEFVKAVVNFAQGTPVVNEGDGTTGIPVRLRLLDPDLQTLTSPLVVNVALGPGSTARIGPSLTHDDLDVPGNTVTFPAGSIDGATANLVVNLHQDFIAELNGETAVLQLASVGTPAVAIAEPNTASVVIQDDDQAGVVVTETDGSTQVSEADPAARDSFGVRLRSQPDFELGTTTPADVTMTVTPDRDCILRHGSTVVTVSDPIVIDIPNADWRTVTTFDVFGVQDLYDEDLRDEAEPHPCEVRFTFTSLDPVYARTHDAVEVDVIDDDTARVVMTPIAQPELAEGSTITATWTAVLTTPPDPGDPRPITPRGPTSVRFTPTAQCDAGAGPGVARDLAFTASNWNVAQEVRITAAQDWFVELLHDCVVQTTVLGDDPVYADLSNPPVFSGTPPGIRLDIQDYDPPNGITDDPPFVDITTSPLDVDEGAGTVDTISVVLRRAPVGAPVVVKLDAVADDPRIDDEQLALRTVGPFLPGATLTFTAANWNIPQTVDVQAVDDDFDELTTHPGSLEARIDSTARGFSNPQLARIVVDGVEIAGTATISADVTDDDTSEVLISETDSITQVAESGGSDTFAAALATHPYADVTVTLTAGADCLVDGGSSKSVMIPADEWETPVSFVVTAIDDEIVESDPHNCPIQVSAASDDSLYDVLPDRTVTARIVDDDIPAVIVNTEGEITVTEGGLTDSFTAVLGNQPEGDVVVEFPGAGGQARTDTRTFTPSNWNVPQTYTVTAVDDDVDENTPQRDTLGMNITTTIQGYQNRTSWIVDGRPAGPGVEVDVADDDTADLTVSPRTISLVEGGAGDTFTAVLGSEPVADVAVSFTPASDCTTTPSGHTFDKTNWDEPVTVTVTATDDDIDQRDDDRVCSVAVATTSTDPNYNGISDNDHRGHRRRRLRRCGRLAHDDLTRRRRRGRHLHCRPRQRTRRRRRPVVHPHHRLHDDSVRSHVQQHELGPARHRCRDRDRRRHRPAGRGPGVFGRHRHDQQRPQLRPDHCNDHRGHRRRRRFGVWWAAGDAGGHGGQRRAGRHGRP